MTVFYEVLVGNIGKVWDSNSHLSDDSSPYDVALTYYLDYVEMSKSGIGRAVGEDVTLWADGDIISEFEGSIRANMEMDANYEQDFDAQEQDMRY